MFFGDARRLELSPCKSPSLAVSVVASVDPAAYLAMCSPLSVPERSGSDVPMSTAPADGARSNLSPYLGHSYISVRV